MTYVPSRTFCCCLPVRFGVFIITLLGMAGGVAFGGLGWYEVVKLKSQLTQFSQAALYIHAILYSLLAIMSVFGFIGAIIRSRSFVSTFFAMLVAVFTFSVFSGAVTLYVLFHREQESSIQQCVTGTAEQPPYSLHDCQHGYNVIKGIAVGGFIVVWLLEIWGCFITNSYVNQLDDEAVANWPKMGSDVEVNQVTGPRPL
jgi:uncharacterized membrane protein